MKSSFFESLKFNLPGVSFSNSFKTECLQTVWIRAVKMLILVHLSCLQNMFNKIVMQNYFVLVERKDIRKVEIPLKNKVEIKTYPAWVHLCSINFTYVCKTLSWCNLQKLEIA